MERFRTVPVPLRRTGYAAWSVEGVPESELTTAAPLTKTVSLPTEDISSPHQQCDSPQLIPLLPSSVSETPGGPGDTTLSHQPPGGPGDTTLSHQPSRPSISRLTRYRTVRRSRAQSESPSDSAPLRQAFSLTRNVSSNDDTKKDEEEEEEEDHKQRLISHEDRSPHSHNVTHPPWSHQENGCSDITECSTDIFRASCELEKENAHFIVVDLVLEVLERVKWTLTLSQWMSTASDTDTHNPAEHSQHIHTHNHGKSTEMDTHRHTEASDADAREQTHCTAEDVPLCQHTQHCAAETHMHEDGQTSEVDTRVQNHNAHTCTLIYEKDDIRRDDDDSTRRDRLTQESEAGSHANTQRCVADMKTHPHGQEQEVDETGSHCVALQTKTLSAVLSTDSGFEDCGVDKTLMSRASLTESLLCPMMHSGMECPMMHSGVECPMMHSGVESPMVHSGVERLAQQLVLVFRRSWFPSEGVLQRGRHSLRTSLLQLPGTGGEVVSGGGRGSLSEEITLRTRMRGTWDWTPPQFTIQYIVHPSHRRSEVVTSQHFLCAGCGTEIEPRYIKKLRYCDYLGKYFCDCCHAGSEAVIPARVLTHWDFSRYSVSNFSKQLLDSVWHQPVFDLTIVGKTLYSRVKELDKFKELQQQLISIKRLLAACRLSAGVTSEFELLPGHLTQRPHLFSMDDLLRVKKGQLLPLARAALRSASTHVYNCELCLARGFICEFCREGDVLFSFQSDTCKRCPVCKACFHRDCFTAQSCCPRCDRIQSRRQLQVV